jgi:hypothetical protein
MSRVMGYPSPFTVVPYLIEINLSRPASQRTDSIGAAVTQVGKAAGQRLDKLVVMVERLTAGGSNDAPAIRGDIERLNPFLAREGKL